MKHYLLLAGLFACVLSASAQKVGTKPNVINQGINPMTQTDNRGKFINEQRVRDMQHDNLMADKHKPSRSIVVNNEQWRNTKTVVKDANGNVEKVDEAEFMDNGNIKSKVSSFYQDGQIIGGYMITYEYDDNGNIVMTDRAKEANYISTYQLFSRKEAEYLNVKFPEAKEVFDATMSANRIQVYNSLVREPEEMFLSDMESYAKQELLNFIYGDRELTQEEYDKFIQELRDLYDFDAYMEAATEQLTAYGLAK